MSIPESHRAATAALAGVAAAAMLVSCTDKLPPPSAPPPVAAKIMRPVIPDSVQTIFTQNCMGANCHSDPASMPFGEILDADSSYARTVNVPSGEMPQFMRIRPLVPDSSYLVKKIRGDPGVGPRMPLNRPALPDSFIQRVIHWVQAGAPPDSVPADSSRLTPLRLMAGHGGR